jgi:voltage-gated potassium channel
VTFTTTGYGDKVPVTLWGRIIGGLVMLTGIVIASFFTATISSIFVSLKLREEKGLQKVFYQDHIVILGWNDSGPDLLDNLCAKTDDSAELRIALINQLSSEATAELLHKYSGDNFKWLKGDYTGSAVLNRAKVEDAKAVVILSEGDLAPSTADERAVLATLTVKSANPRVKVYAHAILRQNESHLKRAGADRVILSDKYTGFLLANCAAQPAIPKVVDSLIGKTKGAKLRVVSIPEDFIHKTFADLSAYFKTELDALLIGFIAAEKALKVADILSHDISSVDDFIARKFREAGLSAEELDTTQMNLNPPQDYAIQESDLAIIIGGKDNV